MTLAAFNPDQVAEDWAQRITSRMHEAGLASNEIAENVFVIRTLTRRAAHMLKENPELALGLPVFGNAPPRTALDEPALHQILELFVRSLNQMMKELRQRGLSQSDQNRILENAAWDTFNFVKLLVGISKMTQIDQIFKTIVSQQQDPKASMMFTLVSECLKLKDFFESERSMQRVVKLTTDMALKKHLQAVTGTPPVV